MIIEKVKPLINDNFLNNLKHQTVQLHAQLEQLPVSLQLTSNQLTINNYIHYLQLMQPVILYTENNIFPVVENIIDDIEERKKSQLIQNDLACLKATSNTAHFNFNIDETDIAVAMGFMYVIEGSTLGGRVILKNVHQVLGLDEENGASYFAGYKLKTGSMWKHFLEILQSFQTSTQTEQKIIEGANAAFTGIYNFMR